MKYIVLIMFIAVSISMAADDSAKPYRPPTEIKLKSGTVLRNVEAQRWEKDCVVVKYIGGVAPIYFRHIARPEAGAIDVWRNYWEEKQAKSNSASLNNQRAAGKRSVRGQAFIVTRGAGNYKLGDMRILVYAGDPKTVYGMFEYASEAPPPITSTRTDADGVFSIDIPRGVHTLVAHGWRLAGRHQEEYFWFVVADETVNLTNSNKYEPAAVSTALRNL